jgi:hypothetical protein
VVEGMRPPYDLPARLWRGAQDYRSERSGVTGLPVSFANVGSNTSLTAAAEPINHLGHGELVLIGGLRESLLVR